MIPFTARRFVQFGIAAALLFTTARILLAQRPADPEEAVDPEAIAFVREMLAQRPARPFSIWGLFHLRHGDGRRSQVPVNFFVRLGEETWESVYETGATPNEGRRQLFITHRVTEPNRYELFEVSLDGSKTNSMVFTGNEAAVPFAGTDFWMSDLGMEFLHWPEQRQIRDAKITMKWGRPMKVIESINPRPGPRGYSRVVSWIDSELGSLTRAEAYDVEGKRFKVFELKSFKKVNGRWEVKEMEIRNDKTDSRTRLEFQFDTGQL